MGIITVLKHIKTQVLKCIIFLQNIHFTHFQGLRVVHGTQYGLSCQYYFYLMVWDCCGWLDNGSPDIHHVRIPRTWHDRGTLQGRLSEGSGLVRPDVATEEEQDELTAGAEGGKLSAGVRSLQRGAGRGKETVWS